MSATEKLSESHRRQLVAFHAETMATANSTESCDKELISSAFRFLYRQAGFAEPAIVFCDSPTQAIIMPLVVEASLLPERRNHVQRLLGDTLYQSAHHRLINHFEHSHLSTYRSILEHWEKGTPRNRAAQQIRLLSKFNHLFTYRLLTGCGPQFHAELATGIKEEISARLEEPVRRQLLSRADTITHAVLEELNQSLEIQPSVRRNLIARRFSGVPFDISALDSTGRANIELSCHTFDATVAAVGVWSRCMNYGWSHLHWLSRFIYWTLCFNHSQRKNPILQMWWHIANHAWAYICHEGVCYVSERPTSLSLDDGGVPHNATVAALVFADGFNAHFWHGRRVPAVIIESPETITVETIDAEDNAEIRRIMLEQYGISRYFQRAAMQIRHHDRYGVLLRKSVANGTEPIQIVRVVNSTPEANGSFKEYFLVVPPDLRTAKEAVAWTFGMTADQYNPSIET
jgi:hypothetical protein